MRSPARPVLFLCLLLLLLPATVAQARRHRRSHGSSSAAEPTPPAAPQPPPELTTGRPSERTTYFLNAYLENTVLVPLDSPVAPPRQPLSALLLSLNTAAAAAPPAQRPAFQAAIALGNTLTQVVDDRLRRLHALLSPFQVNDAPPQVADGAAADPAASGLAESRGGLSPAARRREERRQRREERAQQRSRKHPGPAANRLLIVQRLREWNDDCARYREQIYQLNAQVRAAEVQAGDPTLPADPAVPTPATPAAVGRSLGATLPAATTVVSSPPTPGRIPKP